jgi:hypothetical protein
VTDEPDPTAPAPEGESEWVRRRRLAAVFGDVLPETTTDEREPTAGESRSETPADAWLKDEVPPHHGGS